MTSMRTTEQRLAVLESRVNILEKEITKIMKLLANVNLGDEDER